MGAAEAAGALAANSTDQSQAASSTAPDLSGIPLLLEGADDSAPDAYVAGAGANVTIATVDPIDSDGTGSGSGDAPGQWIVAARPLVLSALPDPATTALPDGTCVDLMDGGGNSLGMFRLDGTAHVWRRRDAPVSATTAGGGSGLSMSWAGAWDASATYGAGAVVIRSNTLYVSLAGGNTDHDPTASDGSGATYWNLIISVNLDGGVF